MSNNIINIGSAPKFKGDYNNTSTYYKNNVVSLYGSVFISLLNEVIGLPPLMMASDGTLSFTNTNCWQCVVDNVDLYNAAPTAYEAASTANTAAANADTATAASKEQTAACKIATDLSQELNNHQPYVGTDNYVYVWDLTTVPHTYQKTDLYVKGDKGDRGDMLYATFSNNRNKIYAHSDDGDGSSFKEHCHFSRNKMIFTI